MKGLREDFFMAVNDCPLKWDMVAAIAGSKNEHFPYKTKVEPTKISLKQHIFRRAKIDTCPPDIVVRVIKLELYSKIFWQTPVIHEQMECFKNHRKKF